MYWYVLLVFETEKLYASVKAFLFSAEFSLTRRDNPRWIFLGDLTGDGDSFGILDMVLLFKFYGDWKP